MSGKNAAGRALAKVNKQAHATKAGGGKGGDRKSTPTAKVNAVAKKASAKHHAVKRPR